MVRTRLYFEMGHLWVICILGTLARSQSTFAKVLGNNDVEMALQTKYGKDIELKHKVVLLDERPSSKNNVELLVEPKSNENSSKTRAKQLNRRRRRKNRRKRRRKNKRKQKAKSKLNWFKEHLLKSQVQQIVTKRGGRRMKQKPWCKTQKMKLKVAEPGCISRTIPNNLCRGQCNSFFVPSSSQSGAFKSCSFCKPKKSSATSVTLICPGKSTAYVYKRVIRVHECQCMTEIFET